MIKDQDKEIDGLLRRLGKSEAAARDFGTTASETHIDADEISVFAENALPEKARTRVISHIADCGRCRTILTNVIALKAEDKAAAVSAADASSGAAISLEIPWYQKLFAVRGLAVALGTLVVLFAGFFAIVIIRDLAGEASVAQLDSGSNSNAEFANTAANSESADAAPLAESNANTPGSVPFGDAPAENESRLNESSDQASAPEPTPEVAGPKKDAAQDLLTEAQGRRDRDVGLLKNQPVPADSRVARKVAPAAAPPPPPVVAAEEVEIEKVGDDQADEADKVSVAGAANAKRAEGLKEKKSETGTRQVEGKTFNQRNGVWYDSAYKGEATINVKRATAQYRSLDAGLRSITDKIPGTVVVVWKTKAYKVE